MKKILISFSLLIFGLTLIGCSSVNAENITFEDDVISNFIDFNLDTFAELTNDENVVFSPISLYYVLAIAYSYSSNSAEEEVEALLGMSKTELMDQINLLNDRLPVSDDSTVFYFENTVFYDNSYVAYNTNIFEQYESIFHYELAEKDFASGEAGRRLVEKIDEGTDHFLSPTEEYFNYLKSSSLLINNTIYYNGTWRTEFSSKYTVEDKFYANDGSEQIVNMMKKLDYSAKYYESEKATAAQKYFMDGSSMIFILPDENMSITDIVNDQNEMLKLLQPNTYYTDASIMMTIPKFSFYNDLTLDDTLKNLGLNSLFSGSNFSLITNDNINVDSIRQMAKIQVDEVGVKVAASTTMNYTASLSVDKIIEFNVNRPFIYIIMSPDQIPLFFGIMYSI